MEIKINRTYIGKKIFDDGLEIEFEKTKNTRPAWILVKNIPEKVFIINTKINDQIHLYKKYLSLKIPLFLPINYTKEEMKGFYNKFSEIYDKHVKQYNVPAAEFLLEQLDLDKDAKILDIGAGTGIGAISFVKSGYKNLSLLEYSSKMLSLAKEKKELKNCHFFCQDVRELDLEEKFDVVISVFSFGLNSYFDENEMPSLWKKIYKHLKKNGILALVGQEYEVPKHLFKEIKKGKFKILESHNANWYVGKRL